MTRRTRKVLALVRLTGIAVAAWFLLRAPDIAVAVKTLLLGLLAMQMGDAIGDALEAFPRRGSK